MKKSFNLQNIANVSVSDFDQLCKTIKMKEEVKKEIRIDGHGSYLWKDIAAGKLITVSSVI